MFTFAGLTRPWNFRHFGPVALIFGALALIVSTGCGPSRHSTVSPPPAAPSLKYNAEAGALIGTEGRPLTGPPGYMYNNVSGLDIETLDTLCFKYAMLLNLPVEAMVNIHLLRFIDEWMGVPYRLGGNTKDGIDCSGFCKILEATVFGLTIPRTSREQYATCTRVDFDQLRPGDLVFFKTTPRSVVSHVGVYLGNGKFVHASTSSGVMISDLSDTYWSAHFKGAGRMAP